MVKTTTSVLGLLAVSAVLVPVLAPVLLVLAIMSLPLLALLLPPLLVAGGMLAGGLYFSTKIPDGDSIAGGASGDVPILRPSVPVDVR